MKLRIIISLLLFVSFSLFAEKAAVTEFKGTVEFLKNKNWSAVKKDQVFSDADVLRTGDKSHVVLTGKFGLVRIESSSQVHISSLSGSAPKFKVNKGFAWFDVKKGVNLRAESPTAVAAVRGTKFALASDEKSTIACVCDGTIETLSLLQKAKSIAASKGEAHTYSADGKLTTWNYKKYFDGKKVTADFQEVIEKDPKKNYCFACHEWKK